MLIHRRKKRFQDRTASFLVLAAAALASRPATAQTWDSVPHSPGMVVSADEMNGKLYLAPWGAGVHEFDGSDWKLLSDFNNSSDTRYKSKQVVRNIGGILYAGAREFNTSGTGIMHTYDGTKWSDLQSADFSYNANFRIRTIEKFRDTIYIGGNFTVPGINQGSHLAKWNGTDWVSAGIDLSGGMDRPVLKLFPLQGRLMAVTPMKIYAYDGAAWDSLKVPIFTSISDAAFYGGAVYVCGNFTQENGTGSFSLARITGDSLQPVGHEYHQVARLYGEETALYAVVRDKHPESHGHVYLAKYTGSWSKVSLLAEYNTGVNSATSPGSEIADYSFMFRYKNDLYMSGRFVKINKQEINGLARLASSSEGILSKGPGAGAFGAEWLRDRIGYRVAQAGWASLKLVDMRGKEIATFVDETKSPGAYTIVLESRLPSTGLYFLRLESGGKVETRPVVLLR